MGRRSRPRIYPILTCKIRKEHKKSKEEKPTQEEIKAACAVIRLTWDEDTRYSRVVDWSRIEDMDECSFPPWEIPIIKVCDLDFEMARMGPDDFSHIAGSCSFYSSDTEDQVELEKTLKKQAEKRKKK